METFRALIGPDTGDATVAQLCFRAAILFAFGVLCIRIAGRRTFSQITPLDIIVALIIGSNISRAMTGKAPFFGGLAATLVVVVLHRLLAMATLHWSPLARLMKGVAGRVGARWRRRRGGHAASRDRPGGPGRRSAHGTGRARRGRAFGHAGGRRQDQRRPGRAEIRLIAPSAVDRPQVDRRIEDARSLLTFTTFHETDD
jgi:hypothetical protein